MASSGPPTLSRSAACHVRSSVMRTAIAASGRFGPLSFHVPGATASARAWRCLNQNGRSSGIVDALSVVTKSGSGAQGADLQMDALMNGVDVGDVGGTRLRRVA